MNRREYALAMLRVAGYHDDYQMFVRHYVENRIGRKAANEAWARGVKQRQAGMKCSCNDCNRIKSTIPIERSESE